MLFVTVTCNSSLNYPLGRTLTENVSDVEKDTLVRYRRKHYRNKDPARFLEYDPMLYCEKGQFGNLSVIRS